MYSIVWISLFLESFGIGHCAWLIFFLTKDTVCRGNTAEELKPQVLRVHSQEILFHPSNPSLTFRYKSCNWCRHRREGF